MQRGKSGFDTAAAARGREIMKRAERIERAYAIRPQLDARRLTLWLTPRRTA